MAAMPLTPPAQLPIGEPAPRQRKLRGRADEVIALAPRGDVGDAGEEQGPHQKDGVDGAVAIAEEAGGPAHGRIGTGNLPAHRSGTCIPSRPVGRKTRTRIKMANIQTSVRADW